MDINTPEQLAENIGKFVNVMGDTDRNRDFIVAMHKQHRTLQQAFTRLAFMWIEHLSRLGDNEIDLRNKASRDIARMMLGTNDMETLYGSEPSKYLPCV